jgi:N-succinyldiaminopimelate aminotransferase
MKPMNNLLSATGTTVFTVMSALAVQHGAINLGQGFPDYEGPQDVIRAAADALLDTRNQYPPLTGVPELRQAVAEANAASTGWRSTRSRRSSSPPAPPRRSSPA